MRRSTIASSCLLGLTLAGAPPRVEAQQPPPGPAAHPNDALRLADPPQPVDVGHQLERVRLELRRAELARAHVDGEAAMIEAQRARLAAQLEGLRAEEEALTESLAGRRAPPISLGARRDTLALTLDEAITRALDQNPDYVVSLLAAHAAEEEVPQAEAAFDPVLTLTGAAERARTPTATTSLSHLSLSDDYSQTYELGLQKRFGPGTVVRLFQTDGFTRTRGALLSPVFGPTAGVEVRQPLLSGRGFDVNAAAIRIARNAALQADASLAEVYIAAALDVESAYWDLVLAEEGLRFQEQFLAKAVDFRSDQRARLAAGTVGPLDVVVAESAVAEQREAVLTAENDLEEARDALMRFVRPSRDSRGWDVLIVPIDRPVQRPSDLLSPDAAVDLALKRRPAVHRALLDVDTFEQDLIVAENGALPSLALVGTFESDGLGGQHHGAYSALGSGRYTTLSLGLELELPIFLRSERARARQAAIEADEARQSLRQVEVSIALEVRRALRDVRTAENAIAASRESRRLVGERLDATRQQLEAGTALPRDVLDDLGRVAAAERRELLAYVRHRLAVSRLRLATGTLLDPWLSRLDPRVRRSLERHDVLDRS